MAALIGREKTGKGCWIDCNLFDTQIAGLANIASNYLIAGQEARRFGTAHPSVVPYQVLSSLPSLGVGLTPLRFSLAKHLQVKRVMIIY